MKKTIKFPHSSFINGINIDKSFCDKVISHFKSNIDKAEEGFTYSFNKRNVDKSVKESLDLDLIDDGLCKTFSSHLSKAIKEYESKYEALKNHMPYSVVENPKIQYYKKGQGFKKWHCERDANVNRMLVWMVYLNNVEDGGTEFKYQKLKIPARKGLFLMWPSDFTHTHRGIISHTKEKYILTGWLGYTE
tara:strand:- start:106 stop:675 length:570 start_codon:yes stop_codon:yes gene_type:complete